MMGTTVTTNLGLIKPDTNESIKVNGPAVGWAAQNAINMEKIDALFRASNTTYVVNLTASSVNPTLGAGGFTEGKIVRFHPRMVIVFFRIFLGGAGFLTGTGTYRIQLPFAMDTTLKNSDGGRTLPIGKAVFQDNSTVLTSSVFLVLYDPINDILVFELSQGDLLASTFPPAQNDRLSGYFMYPTATA